ncbi:hypothetical protein RZS08_36585, partial [Arthrospira platensis SPKY1]|nr:hypothetical protein [Arthrospira platensis SPKY1]
MIFSFFTRTIKNIQKMKKYAVGIDIGGTNTGFGFADVMGNCFAKASIKTGDYEDVNDFVKVLSDKIKSQLETLEDAEIAGIGIGAPNGNYYRGTIEMAPNL